ncbi:hypothetical protein OAM67_01580 [bacterium]|nr:hypothetical protein [bacterium]
MSHLPDEFLSDATQTVGQRFRDASAKFKRQSRGLMTSYDVVTKTDLVGFRAICDDDAYARFLEKSAGFANYVNRTENAGIDSAIEAVFPTSITVDPIKWMPFSRNVHMIPLRLRGHNSGVVFKAQAPPQGHPHKQNYDTAVTNLLQHCNIPCSCCNTNLRDILLFLDAHGPVATRCVAETLVRSGYTPVLHGTKSLEVQLETQEAAASSSTKLLPRQENHWYVELKNLQEQVFQYAVFVPRFVNADRTRFEHVGRGAATDRLFQDGSGGTPLPILTPINMDGSLSEDVGSVQQRVKVMPQMHVCVRSFSEPQTPADDILPPAAQQLYDDVYATSAGPVYVRNAIRDAKRLDDALSKLLLTAKTQEGKLKEMHRSMARAAAKWTVEAGATTTRAEPSAASASAAAPNPNDLQVLLEWKCWLPAGPSTLLQDGTQKAGVPAPSAQELESTTTPDLDFHLFFLPTATLRPEQEQQVRDRELAEQLQAQSAPAVKGCGACTFHNPPTATRCILCNSTNLVTLRRAQTRSGRSSGSGGGAGGGGGKPTAAKVQKVHHVFYSQKNLCAHPDQMTSSCNGSAGYASYGGTSQMISLVHDTQHSRGSGKEEIRIGADVTGRMMLLVHNYASGPRHAQASAYRITLQTQGKTVYGDWRVIPRAPEKAYYDDAGLGKSILVELGVETKPETQAALSAAPTVKAVRGMQLGSIVTEKQAADVLRSGGGITLPLPPELFNDAVKTIDSAEQEKRQEIARQHFGGVPTAQMLHASELTLIWCAHVANHTDPGFYMGLGVNEATAKLLAMPQRQLYVPLLDQSSVVPAFAFKYVLNGQPMFDNQTQFASFPNSRSGAIDGLNPVNKAAGRTGQFSPAEWSKAVRFYGSTAGSPCGRVTGIAQTSRRGTLYFLLETMPDACASGNYPTAADGYDLDHMPVIALAKRASRDAAATGNHKQIRSAVQQLESPLQKSAFQFNVGFMVNPGLTFTLRCQTHEPKAETVRLTTEQPTTRWRQFRTKARYVTPEEIAKAPYDQMPRLLQEARSIFHNPDNSFMTKAYDGLGRFLATSDDIPPAANRLLYSVHDLHRNIVFQQGGKREPSDPVYVALEQEHEDDRDDGDDGEQGEEEAREAELAPEPAPTPSSARPSTMPPHKWAQLQARKKLQQERDQKKIAKQQMLALARAHQLDSLVQQTMEEAKRVAIERNTALTAQKEQELQRLQQQRAELRRQQHELDQRKRASATALKADMITCPITQLPMHDPVSTPDGHSFERAAIVQWLQTHATNPVSRAVLTTADLTTNLALKAICQQFHANAN